MIKADDSSKAFEVLFEDLWTEFQLIEAAPEKPTDKADEKSAPAVPRLIRSIRFPLVLISLCLQLIGQVAFIFACPYVQGMLLAFFLQRLFSSDLLSRTIFIRLHHAAALF